MRKMISAMKISIDGKTEGPEGYADWVDSWSDDYQLTPQIDACVLGGGMYPNYEQYWTAIQDTPNVPNPMGVGVPHRPKSNGLALRRQLRTTWCRVPSPPPSGRGRASSADSTRSPRSSDCPARTSI